MSYIQHGVLAGMNEDQVDGDAAGSVIYDAAEAWRTYGVAKVWEIDDWIRSEDDACRVQIGCRV